MRRLGVLAGVMLLILSSSGCIINQYAADDNIRQEQLLFQSEDLRQIREEWRRFWFNDMPSHLTPQRLHGGIIP